MYYGLAEIEVEALMRERQAVVEDPEALQREEALRHRSAARRRSRRAHVEERVLSGETPADAEQKRLSEDVYGENLLRALLLSRR